MLRGFYTAAAGMITQNRRQQMLTNNIANMNTPGYKADQSAIRSFPETLAARIGGDSPGAKNIGSLSTGTYLQEMVPDFGEGPLKETEKSTDVSLIQTNVPKDPQTGRPGALFFTVQTAQGPRYTRNGHFTVDGKGVLTTASGQAVLAANGQRINLPNDHFQVSSDGTVTVNGTSVAELGIAFAADPNQLAKEGTSLFRAAGNNGALPSAVNNPALGYHIQQGFLEQSNVSPEQAMTDLTTTYRAFEANQKVLQAYDRSMEKAVNEVGRIS